MKPLPVERLVQSIDRYILRQLFAPLLVGVIVITAIVWLTQSLQRLDLVIDYGEGWGDFALLTLLLIPSLLVVVLPFAVFGAALFAFQRLMADSEISVMFASGLSKMRLARPLLLLAALSSAMVLWLNLDLMPRSYRQLKEQIAALRADFASAVLRAGEFTALGDDFTVYVEEALPGGRFNGLLIHDYRDRERPITYMAQRALLRGSTTGPILYLSNGNRQSAGGAGLDIVLFDQTAINITAFTGGSGQVHLETTERYLGELLHPDLSNTWERENAGTLIAEGHARLAAPLYPFAYAFIALYILLGGAYSRRGHGVKILIACCLAGGVRIIAFVVQSIAAETGAYWMLYLLPVMAGFGVILVMNDSAQRALRRLWSPFGKQLVKDDDDENDRKSKKTLLGSLPSLTDKSNQVTGDAV